MKKYILILLTLLLFIPNSVKASTQAMDLIDTIKSVELTPSINDYIETKDQVTVYLFRNSGCTHCHEAITFFNSILKEYKDKIKMRSYETSNPDNYALQKKIADFYEVGKTGVPLIIIGEKYIYGFGESSKNEIKEAIDTLYNQTNRYDVFEEFEKENPQKPNPNNQKSENEIKKDKYGIYIIIGVVISTLLIITLLLIYKKNNV